MFEPSKTCTKCGQTKPVSAFQKAKGQKSGLRPDCVECNRASAKSYYERNKQKILERARKYGKTDFRKDYMRKYQHKKNKEKRDNQANRPRPLFCECCGDHGTNQRHGIVFDHDHLTGKFRGWLCNRCNRVLGMCKDNPRLLRLLATYLEENTDGKGKK